MNKNMVLGAYTSHAIRRMKKSGLSGENLEIAIAAIRGGDTSTKPFKIPRKVAKRLGEELAENRRAVVVVGDSGKMTVFSVEGYASAKANAHKNKPWEKRHVPAEPVLA